METFATLPRKCRSKDAGLTASSNEASAAHGDANASNCPVILFSVSCVWLFDNMFPDLLTKHILVGEAHGLPAITNREMKAHESVTWAVQACFMTSCLWAGSERTCSVCGKPTWLPQILLSLANSATGLRSGVLCCPLDVLRSKCLPEAISGRSVQFAASLACCYLWFCSCTRAAIAPRRTASLTGPNKCSWARR